jgi:hypothetical protein
MSEEFDSEEEDDKRPKKKHKSKGHGFILEEAG